MKYIYAVLLTFLLCQLSLADRMVSLTCKTGGQQTGDNQVAIPSGTHILQGYCKNHNDCQMFCMTECRSGNGGCGNGGTSRPNRDDCYCAAPYSG
uniref:Putative secreted salivary protein n=1 Tax=Xenopsylla cheopis TaxID=163159 RepID=A2IA82_XENCH|nr:putative secreted salivary protein [Xenopsylla cheopis]